MVDTSMVNVIKRKEVERVIQIARKTGVVRRLIIFGSAVTDDCREESDVDMCLDISCETSDKRLRRPMYDFNEACDFNCDILFYHKLGEKLRKEIDSKGVAVYVDGQS
ncbi:MAG: nucleotidyltransferase domain-containing protein [Lachnospiraceae bacterium]|nr:nucleotidyltransferase domain-containing protein [Lachnospiraceae bacterium]MCD8103735.1 nucleotidyltransferase domain-containing protein [Lachnospiraceae bacterium]